MEQICIICNKKPQELEEYAEMAKEEEMSIEDYVAEQEGTYNSANGHFYCTSCYIKIGMPLGIAP